MSSNAPAASEDHVDGEKPVKKAGKRKMILLAAPILLVAAIGSGLWFSGILSHRSKSPAQGVATVTEKPSLVDVPDIVTNLDSGSHRAVFVKLKAKVEVAHIADQAAINGNMPRILDVIQTYLRSMRPEELHGGEGTYRLREALMNRINVIVYPVQVNDIIFTGLLIQ